jgi:hypothetical protein
MGRHMMVKHPGAAKQMEQMLNADPQEWGRETKPQWGTIPEINSVGLIAPHDGRHQCTKVDIGFEPNSQGRTTGFAAYGFALLSVKCLEWREKAQ